MTINNQQSTTSFYLRPRTSKANSEQCSKGPAPHLKRIRKVFSSSFIFWKRVTGVRKIKYLNIRRLSFSSGGFSLFEVVLALSIFSIIVTIVGSVFAFLIKTQARALNAQKIQENGQFILETVARELRVANCLSTDVNCQTRLSDSDCSVPRNTITIQHPVNGTVVYNLTNNTVTRSVGGLASQISSNGVRIANLNFCIQNNSSSDGKQSKVTIQLMTEAGSGRDYVSAKLQTTLSLRTLAD